MLRFLSMALWDRNAKLSAAKDPWMTGSSPAMLA
jgi:hypothetical protein